MTVIKDVWAFRIVSVIVVLVLGMQAVAGFVDTGRWGWPIIAYPMYKIARYEGDRVLVDATAYAILSDGTRVKIDRDELGWSFWIYWSSVIQQIRQGRLHTLRPVLEVYCPRHDGKIVELIVEDQGIAVSRAGPVYGLPPLTIYSVEASCE